MSKKLGIIIVLTVVLISFLGVRPAYAADNDPDYEAWSELLLEAFAIETGKTVAQIQDFRDDGLTYREIALELGYEGEELTDLFERVSDTVLELAVEDGLISEDDSDKLSRRLKLIKTISSWIVDKILERLGLTKEEFIALLNSGMTIREIFGMEGIERTGSNNLNFCGISREEFIALIRSGESVSEICPGFVPFDFDREITRPTDLPQLRP